MTDCLSRQSEVCQYWQGPICKYDEGNPVAVSTTVSSQSCAPWIQEIAAARLMTFSQGYQDGILQAIFNKIGTTNKFFVEFGFGYMGGKEIQTEADMDHAAAGLNTRNLKKQGWDGVYFDAVVENPKFKIVKGVLTEDNIVEIFDKANIPLEADYVSIDVDSVDIWLLQGLLKSKKYRPRVISVEYNVNFGRALIAHQREWHEWNHNAVFGTSVGNIDLVAREHGYHVVHVMPQGLDTFLVRDDIIEKFCDIVTVPVLEEMAPFLPMRQHKTCPLSDAQRVVYFPLAREGKNEEAHARAIEELKKLDRENADKPSFKEVGPICNYDETDKSSVVVSSIDSGRSCAPWLQEIGAARLMTFSQGYQDGILQAIFNKIGTTNKFFVEFGFGYMGGKEIQTEADMDHAAAGLNTRNLKKQGWDGVYFDAVVDNPKFKIVKGVLTEDNIVEIFDKAKIPREADYVSIDVDSVDIWLLHGLLKSKKYRPRVISVEYNVNFGRALITHQREWHEWGFNGVYGTSVGNIDLVARENGYHVIHVMPQGLDTFLVRDDIIEKVCDVKTVPSLEEMTPYLPMRQHRTCSPSDAHRVVYFPLAREGRMEEAYTRGLRELKKLDRENAHKPDFKEVGPICHYA